MGNPELGRITFRFDCYWGGAPMNVNLGFRAAIVLFLVAALAPGVEAVIISSSGTGTYTHSAKFDGAPVVVSGGVGAPIPLLPSVQSHNSTITSLVTTDNSHAVSSVTQTFNWAGVDSHLITVPGGFDISVDDSNDSLDALGLGNASATFRLDFGVSFFLADIEDGVVVPLSTFVNFPFTGNAPAGYQVDLVVGAIWVDNTVDDAPVPSLILGDSQVFSEVGPFAGALVDAGFWGGFTADGGGSFSLSGSLEIRISKDENAEPAEVGAGLALGGGLIIPEPCTLTVALLGGVCLAARRRHKKIS